MSCLSVVKKITKTMTSTKYFQAFGKVQKVMFRQTIIRGAMKRNLRAGATNVEHDKTQVLLTLEGDEQKIQEIVSFLQSGKDINSSKAKVSRIVELHPNKPEHTPLCFPIAKHQVTTDNVDDFNWRTGVQFFL